MTYLSENSAADFTQLVLPPTPDEQAGVTSRNPEGVECASAYTMLMQYANSDERMDKIAKALEKGCTSSEGGACVMKKSVIWKVLDYVCVDEV